VLSYGRWEKINTLCILKQQLLIGALDLGLGFLLIVNNVRTMSMLMRMMRSGRSGSDGLMGLMSKYYLSSSLPLRRTLVHEPFWSPLTPMVMAQAVRFVSSTSTEGTSTHKPTEIRLKKQEKALEITFQDGKRFRYPAEYLRVESPSVEVIKHPIALLLCC